MEPNSWPLDPLLTAALVIRAIDDIDACDEEDLEVLLEDLMRAAWGSIWAQNQ
jgi:hypothetical protein